MGAGMTSRSKDSVATNTGEYISWYREGDLHREGGPAVERINGDRYWYRNGQLHREDGPAIEYATGDKYWYKHGQLHRDGGPAVLSCGNRIWCSHGRYHREDGPAIERADGKKEWWLEGMEASQELVMYWPSKREFLTLVLKTSKLQVPFVVKPGHVRNEEECIVDSTAVTMCDKRLLRRHDNRCTSRPVGIIARFI